MGKRHSFSLLMLFLGACLLPTQNAHALKAIQISPDAGRIEITPLGELYEGRGDSLQIETASNLDGTSGRLSVRASVPGSNPNWIVFALHNPTDTTVERWISADRYTIIGSGLVWPDLDAHRIEAITPSVGFVPERMLNERADLFRITLEPGQTITYIAELSSDRYSRIYLWKPLEYELKVRDRQLFNGVMLGLTGLLAVFLTAIFAANHKIIFPAASLVAWSVLAYLCVDFGFFHKLFQLNAENNAVYRASTEAAMGAALVLFLGLFLRAPAWNRSGRTFMSVWLLTQFCFIFLALIDARLASTFARTSFIVIGTFGFVLTLFFASRGQDRAISLIPTWLFLLVWIFGTGLTLTGHLSGDMVVSSLDAGLVLIVLLIGFTVTQFAFKSHQPLFGFSPSDLHLKSLAVDGSGAGIWEWNPLRKKIKVSENIEVNLGLNTGELNTNLQDFCRYVHPADLERFKLSLEVAEERYGGHIHSSFRLRKADNSYRWYEVSSSPILSSDGRSFKSVGLMRDVTESRRTQERLLQDAVKCSLTGLPHRQLLIDRLNIIMRRAKSEPLLRPTMMVIDLDKFKSVNVSYGLALGDSLLLAVTRRLQRYIEDEDTLARIGSDRFALLLVKQRTAAELAGLAENVRRSLRSPMTLGGQEVILTSSIGIAVYDPQIAEEQDLLREAEVAVFRAKRTGIDSIVIYRPEAHTPADDHSQMWVELQKSIEKSQLKLLYRPIVYLPTEELAGFEAIVRWDHPKYGLINPFSFLDERAPKDLFSKTLRLALVRSLKHCSHWQKELPRGENPLFVSLNLPEGIPLTEESTSEIRRSLSHHTSAKGSLRIGIPESSIVVNPELNIEILSNLQTSGAEIILDGFGLGYSSFPYLERLPIQMVRANFALSSGNINAVGSGGMLRAVIAMAHELGLKVLIDGLETNEDVAFLRSISCEYGQGFYYGDYISQREILRFIRQIRKAEQRLQSRGFFRSTSDKKTVSKAKPSRKAQPQSLPSDTMAIGSLQKEREAFSPVDTKENFPASPVSGSSDTPVALDAGKAQIPTSFPSPEREFLPGPLEEAERRTFAGDDGSGPLPPSAAVTQSADLPASTQHSAPPLQKTEDLVPPPLEADSKGEALTGNPHEPPPLAATDLWETKQQPAPSFASRSETPFSRSDQDEDEDIEEEMPVELRKKSKGLDNISKYEKLPPQIAESLRKLAG